MWRHTHSPESHAARTYDGGHGRTNQHVQRWRTVLQCATTDGAYTEQCHMSLRKKETTINLIPDLLLCCLGNVL